MPRLLRRTLVVVVGLVVAVTVAAGVVDVTTAGPAPEPSGLTFVDAAGVRTRLLQWGSHGSPVVLVHGFAENAQVWGPLAQLLSTDHVVYGYDVVGWGYTEHTGRYGTDEEVAQLLGVLDALHLDRPVLVGHSAGAAAVAGAALRAPERVGGLMFLDGDGLDTGVGSSPGPDLSHAPWSLYSTAVLRVGLRSDALVRKVYATQCGPDCPRLDTTGVDLWRRPFQVAGGETALWKRLALPVSGYPAEHLAELAALPLPKAVVFGQHDDDFTPASPDQTARLIGAPPATIVAGGRHLTMVGEPATVAGAVEELCTRVQASPGSAVPAA